MSAELREPHGPSVAYSMGVGIGRGRPANDAASAVSYSSTPVLGRGAPLQTGGANADGRRRNDVMLANAQRPYEQYLVIAYCSVCIIVVL